jgi:UDP-GlcNAc:undecaprenyl-phosphate GlcNAc-1-phosphate transferase
MSYLLVFCGSLITALIVTPLARRLSFQLGILAEPGGRRQHQGQIPKLGGLAVFVAWAVGLLLIYGLYPPDQAADALRLRGVIVGSLVMVAAGLIDDWRELPPWTQLAMQLVGAAIAVLHTVFIEVFTSPIGASPFWTTEPISWVFRLDGNLVWVWRPLAILFTVFWVVGMINAVNMLDGLDGLAAGVCTIAAVMFAWHSYRLGQVTVPLLPLALAGALVGFLPFNFSPARIFLGTAGAFLLGYQMATLSILSPAKLSTALLVMAVPILDVAWQIVDRLRRGKNPLQGDRGHLHFRLSDGGLPTRQIVLGYYLVAIFFGLIAIFAPSGLVKLILWFLVVLAVVIVLIWLSRRS